MSVNKSRGAKFIQKSYQGNSFFFGAMKLSQAQKACSFQKLNLIVKMTRSTKPIAQAKTTYASARKLNAFSFLSLSLSLKPAPTLSLSHRLAHTTVQHSKNALALSEMETQSHYSINFTRLRKTLLQS